MSESHNGGDIISRTIAFQPCSSLMRVGSQARGIRRRWRLWQLSGWRKNSSSEATTSCTTSVQRSRKLNYVSCRFLHPCTAALIYAGMHNDAGSTGTMVGTTMRPQASSTEPSRVTNTNRPVLVRMHLLQPTEAAQCAVDSSFHLRFCPHCF